MRKIPTVFVRDFRTHLVTPEVTPGCEWVLKGEGVPTRKFDGTCVYKDDEGKWWARRTVKEGRTPPANFVPIEKAKHRDTEITIGWTPIEDSPHYGVWLLARDASPTPDAGTYELIGPDIPEPDANPERVSWPGLVAHRAAVRLHHVPTSPTFAKLGAYLTLKHEECGMEGIVWHHPDGRMAKLKAKDFTPLR